jgi:hypothetical protein
VVFPEGPGGDEEALCRKPRSDPERAPGSFFSREEINSVRRHPLNINVIPEDVVVVPKVLQRLKRTFRRVHERFTPYRDGGCRLPGVLPDRLTAVQVVWRKITSVSSNGGSLLGGVNLGGGKVCPFPHHGGLLRDARLGCGREVDQANPFQHHPVPPERRVWLGPTGAAGLTGSAESPGLSRARDVRGEAAGQRRPATTWPRKPSPGPSLRAFS